VCGGGEWLALRRQFKSFNQMCPPRRIFQGYSAMLGSFSRRAIGSILLVLVCVLWVASSELTQFIFADLDFSRPFFFTWFATSLFQFYLFGFLVCKPWRLRCAFLCRLFFFLPILPPRSAELLTLSFLANATTHTLCPSSIPLHNPSMGAAPATSFRGPPSRVYVNVFERENTLVNAMRLCRPAVLSRAHSHTPGCLSLRNCEYQLDFVCVLVFGQPHFQCESGVYVCCCEHRALVIQVPPTTLHPPLSITCVFHSSIWTLVLGHFFFKTPVSRRSVGAAIVCVGGIVLVVGFDYGELKGNLLAVASAVLYSVYSLVLRARAPDNIDVSMSMMFGFIGPDAHILPFVISFQYCLAFLQGFFRLLGLGRCCLFCTSHVLRFVVACVVSKLLLTIFHNFSGVCVARLENVTFFAAQWLSGFSGQRCFVGSVCCYDFTLRCLCWACTHYSSWLDRGFRVPQERCAHCPQLTLFYHIADFTLAATVQPPTLLHISNRR